jgi:hypothetical protein
MHQNENYLFGITMQVVNFHTGKTLPRDDKMAAFEFLKPKLLLKDIRNQL